MEHPKSSSILRKSSNILNQSDVLDLQKPLYVMLVFETRTHRLELFAQVILISVTPVLKSTTDGV